MATTWRHPVLALRPVTSDSRTCAAGRSGGRDRESWRRHDHSAAVLILQARPRALHHGTMGAVRSLGRVGVSVHASREAADGAAGKSRYLSPGSPRLMSGDAAADVEALRDFQRTLGRPVAVLAVDDAGAAFLAENRDALGPEFLLPSQRPDLPREVASKANLPQLRRIAGVTIPETAVARASHCAPPRDMDYPLVIKAAEPSLLPAGVPPVALARDAEDLARYCASMGPRARAAAELVLQEYIPENAAEDWFYHGYHRTDGEAVVGFTGLKLRSYPPFFGATSYAVSIFNEEVAALAQRILRNLRYAGVVELEFRLDKRDGAYKLIDFNPRLGAQFQLLRNEHGIDVVRAMHLDLTGRETPAGGQVEWTAFASDFTEAAAFRAYRRDGRLRPGAWLRQFLGAESRTWFAWDDMRPFFAAAVRWTGQSLAPARAAAGSGRPREVLESRRAPDDVASTRGSDTPSPRRIPATAGSAGALEP